MSYRDDHDAALARADALADEVEQLKREREKLAAELEDAKAHEAAAVAAASAPPPARVRSAPAPDVPVPTTDAERDWLARRAMRRTSDRKAALAISGVLLLLLGGAALYGVMRDRERTKARAAKAARAAADQLAADRLHIAANLSACIADSVWGDANDQFYAEKHCRDMQREHCENAFAVHRFECVRELEQLASDPGYPTKAAGPALDHLRQANAAVTAARDRAHRDAAVTQRRAAFDEVRADVLPAFRKTIDARLAAATKHDDAYWRAKIILEFRDLIDAALVASKVESGGEIDFVAAALIAQPMLDRIEAEPRSRSVAKNWSYFTKEVRAGVLDRDTVVLFMHNELSTLPIENVR